MPDRLPKLRATLCQRFPDTDLSPLGAPESDALRSEFPGIPDDLLAFYREVGCGTIGASRYMIHDPTHPDAFYDDETARSLAGIVIVGDNFSGTCDAYDSRNGWAFGSIDSSGKFQRSSQHATFIEFLESGYAP